jgi:hypothetical protein
MFEVTLADRRRDAESKLRTDIAVIPESEDAESYLPAFQTFGSTLFDAEAEEALDRSATEALYKTFMRDVLALRLIEGIMPDRGLASVRAKWSPEFSKLSTEKGIVNEILLECREDGTKAHAREEILEADAPHGDFENFAPAAIRLSLRFPKNALIRESLRQVFERRIHYWIGRFRVKIETVLTPTSIPSHQRMGTPSLDVQRSFPPSRYSFSGGPFDQKLRADLYEEIGWLAREIQVLEGPPGLPPSDAVDRLLGRLTAQRGGEVDADYALNEMRKHCRASGVHRLETGESSKAAAFEGFAVRIEGLQNRFGEASMVAAPERPRERALSVRIAPEESSATQIGRSKEGVMKIFPGREFPKHMHHATKLPVIVNSAREQAELGPEWSEKYIFQAYPKCKYTWNEKSVTVQNAEEEAALGKDWADTPGAFAPYRGPAKRTPEQDPTKWVAQWSLPGLSEDHRRKIKAQLIRVDGAFWKSPDASSADVDALRQAFTGIARVLSEAGILTEEMLRDQIPLLVWDSAIAGGWYRFASETPQDIFPDHLGHYWVRQVESVDWKGLFYSETMEWLAWLLENPGTPANLKSRAHGPLGHSRSKRETASGPEGAGSDRKRAKRRKTRSVWLDRRIAQKTWSSDTDIAHNGGPTYNTIVRYRSGVRSTRDTYVRGKFAKAFDCNISEVPE